MDPLFSPADPALIAEFLRRLDHPVAIVGRKPRDPHGPQLQVAWGSNDPVDAACSMASEYGSVYVNLNPMFYPDIVYEHGISIRDEMIRHRTRLLLDVDGHSVPKSEAERQKDAVKAYLGWPVLIETDSGNGFGLIYEVELPNDRTSRDLVKRFLKELKSTFPCVDASVFNAGRLTRLIGTPNGSKATRLLKDGDSSTTTQHDSAERPAAAQS